MSKFRNDTLRIDCIDGEFALVMYDATNKMEYIIYWISYEEMFLLELGKLD